MEVKENNKKTKAIVQFLESQGYDEIIIALGKKGSIVTTVYGNNQSTPYILHKFFNDMSNAEKLIFMALALGMGEKE